MPETLKLALSYIHIALYYVYYRVHSLLSQFTSPVPTAAHHVPARSDLAQHRRRATVTRLPRKSRRGHGRRWRRLMIYAAAMAVIALLFAPHFNSVVMGAIHSRL